MNSSGNFSITTSVSDNTTTTFYALASDLSGVSGCSIAGLSFVEDSTLIEGNVATFVAVDSTTQGTWIGNYGSEGHAIYGDTTSYPAYATATITGASTYTWVGSTADVRAVQKADNSTRLAAVWYSGSPWEIDLTLTGGHMHQVSLYMTDWDTSARIQTIEVLDADTNAVLDTRSVSSFNGGKYVTWSIAGHVKIRITRTAGANGVINAIFFD